MWGGGCERPVMVGWRAERYILAARGEGRRYKVREGGRVKENGTGEGLSWPGLSESYVDAVRTPVEPPPICFQFTRKSTSGPVDP